MTPWRSTATSSAMDSASSWSWVTRTEVVPAWRSTLRTSERTEARIAASSEEKGSSKRTISGSMASARARATRCCCPPES